MVKKKEDDKRRYLSIEDCATELSVTKMTIWRYIKKGSLQAICPGRVWRISRKDWNLFLHGRVKK